MVRGLSLIPRDKSVAVATGEIGQGLTKQGGV